jgi:hypothetical protein
MMRWLEGGYKLAVVFNMWAFLYKGKYRWVGEGKATPGKAKMQNKAEYR